MKNIVVYTDGGSRNTGNVKGGSVKATDKAAWAFLIAIENGKTHYGTGGEYGATNNQMEITAVLKSLRALYKLEMNNENITIVSDSQYVLNSITKWLTGWKKNGWKNASKKEVKNKDLWIQIDNALPHFPNIRFEWTKGHAGNAGNNYVDELLNQTMDKM
ncbi:ribonuclease HI [Pilibacter termitis]|uniref:ribonuclease H n=1 Tax=Pilibacter termitis TaxID=263852 RepID=A0A1T4NAT2_9ENTE|nr:ribonuclease H [Pilibacter termitis]SJZ75908.1 ribonuclease HI [Pilibacter termitis]